MKTFYATITAAIAFAFAAPAQAIPTAYANPGTESNVQYEFVAAATGDVRAYFVGSNAAYTTRIALLVNGVDTGIYGLDNHSSAYGQMLNFGQVNANDSLVFKLINVNSPEIGPFYSDLTLNADGRNHIYAAAYDGDEFIPAGIAVGFEDQPNGGDFDYNDENFVFVNVANAPEPSDVPEPASIALLLAGAAGFGVSRRAKRARKN